MNDQSQIIEFNRPSDAQSDAPQPPAPAAKPVKKKKERIFKDGPWAQKLMLGSDIKLAVESMERLEMRVTEWLGEAIRLRVAQERGEITWGGSGQTSDQTALVPVSASSMAVDEIDAIDRLISVAQRIAAIQGRDLAPNSQVLVAARRRLVRMLG